MKTAKNITFGIFILMMFFKPLIALVFLVTGIFLCKIDGDF